MALHIAFERRRQEDPKVEDSMDYIMQCCLKTKYINKRGYLPGASHQERVGWQSLPKQSWADHSTPSNLLTLSSASEPPKRSGPPTNHASWQENSLSHRTAKPRLDLTSSS